jgi:hypothetical protein
MINVDEFAIDPSMSLWHSCRTSKPPKAAIEDLQTADVEISTVRVLHGEEGADILDPTGAEHGSATRIIRWLQTRGYDRNILDVYEEGLNNGEALITVQCAPADSRRLGRVMLPHGAHAVIYFGPGTAETLTAP